MTTRIALLHQLAGRGRAGTFAVWLRHAPGCGASIALTVVAISIVHSGVSQAQNFDRRELADVREDQKALLTLQDLHFVGAFKLPQQACGESTGYAAGCLAWRRIGKNISLFSDSHINTGGAVYEMKPPEAALKEPYPTATIVKEWGDIYQGKKQKSNGESYELSGTVPTTGLRWDDPVNRCGGLTAKFTTPRIKQRRH